MLIKIDICDYRLSAFGVRAALVAVGLYAGAMSYWMLMGVMILIALSLQRIIVILGNFKVQSELMSLVIYPDATINVLSDEKIVARGQLLGQAWLSSQAVVIRVVAGGQLQTFTALAMQQRDKDVFRRLSSRLRHQFYQPAVTGRA